MSKLAAPKEFSSLEFRTRAPDWPPDCPEAPVMTILTGLEILTKPPKPPDRGVD